MKKFRFSQGFHQEKWEYFRHNFYRNLNKISLRCSNFSLKKQWKDQRILIKNFKNIFGVLFLEFIRCSKNRTPKRIFRCFRCFEKRTQKRKKHENTSKTQTTKIKILKHLKNEKLKQSTWNFIIEMWVWETGQQKEQRRSSHFRQSEAQEAAEESSGVTETSIRGAANGSSQKITWKREQLGNTWKRAERKRWSERAQKVIMKHSGSACANHVCNAFAFCFWSFYAFFDFPFWRKSKDRRKETLNIAPKIVPIFSCSKISSSNLV